MNCAHCCENSGRFMPTKFMSIDKIEKYIHEFKELPYDTSEHIVIGGGEGLAPYLFGKSDYIPKIVTLINKNGGVPTIKTNGIWGNREDTRKFILKDLAKIAYRTNKLVTLDISLDEFHKNISAVSNIFVDILSSDFIMMAIRLVLVGFNTKASASALSQLKHELNARKIMIDEIHGGDMAVYNDKGKGFLVITDYNGPIYNLGRAKENNIATAYYNHNLSNLNCIQIDNNDVLTLNYAQCEKIAGKKLKDVIDSLLSVQR